MQNDRGIEFTLTFCIDQKVTKNLVALKTRLINPSLAWIPGMLARLLVFQILFLSLIVTHRVLSLHETGR